jgi:NAD-dependent DNA ligase
MSTKFNIVVETGQGNAVYPAESLQEAIEIYREQLDTYPESQIHLLRDMPPTATVVNAAGKGGIAEAMEKSQNRQRVEKHKQIDSRFLKQQTEGADSSNPLYKKIVVMSGMFDQIGMSRDEVAEALQKLGAKVNRSMSSTIQVFVQGDKSGPSKLGEVMAMRASGKDVRIITPIELKEIFDKYITNS